MCGAVVQYGLDKHCGRSYKIRVSKGVRPHHQKNKQTHQKYPRYSRGITEEESGEEGQSYGKQTQ